MTFAFDTGESIKGDSFLHIDGNHNILVVLKGVRTCYVHMPSPNAATEDERLRCKLDTKGRDSDKQLTEDEMDKCHRANLFCRIEAGPGDANVVKLK